MNEFPQGTGLRLEDLEIMLLNLPHEIAETENLANQARMQIDALKAQVELAETNAALMADASGKDAETRKLQRTQAVESDAIVVATRSDLNDAKLQLADAETAAEAQRRLFAAHLKIAELRAAQIAAQIYQMNGRV